MDKVTKAPEPKPEVAPVKVHRSDEPEDEDVDEPVKRPAKKADTPAPKVAKANLADVVKAWGEDD
jgi:hypothetical protein